jgi:hypothetical protein
LDAAADPYADKALVPALDELANADLGRELLISLPRGVELFAGRVLDAYVVDRNGTGQ